MGYKALIGGEIIETTRKKVDGRFVTTVVTEFGKFKIQPAVNGVRRILFFKHGEVTTDYVYRSEDLLKNIVKDIDAGVYR